MVSLQCHIAVTELLQGDTTVLHAALSQGNSKCPSTTKGFDSNVGCKTVSQQCHIPNEVSPHEPQRVPLSFLLWLRASFDLQNGFHPCLRTTY